MTWSVALTVLADDLPRELPPAHAGAVSIQNRGAEGQARRAFLAALQLVEADREGFDRPGLRYEVQIGGHYAQDERKDDAPRRLSVTVTRLLDRMAGEG